MSYKIKEVAALVGVSTRTLHHYDNIGLIRPEALSASGYRLYADKDLERLQQVLFFKELGFNLREVKEILDNPSFDRKEALCTQKELLLKKIQRLEAIISTVDKTLKSIEGGFCMSKNEMFKAFDMADIEKHQKEYAEEARNKYGDSEAYKESQKKTSQYTKDDWGRITTRGNEIYAKIASLMEKGPADPAVQEAVGEWRQHITDNFYNCSLEIFRGLGDLYVNDERFTKNINKVHPGLAQFLQKAMHHYCDNNLGISDTTFSISK